MGCAKMWWLFTLVMIYLINSTAGDQPRIIIIGAGPSGIAAASKLYVNGFEDITILEAENRIGGRINTIWFGDSWIDLGAQWVHGQTNNIVYEIASPLGLLQVPDGEVLFHVYNSEGVLVPNSISDDIIKLWMELDESSGDDPTGSVGEYFNTMLTDEAKKFPAVNETMLGQFMYLVERLQNVADGSDNWYNTSTRGYSEYVTCPGNELVNWKDRGYSTILDILMKKYPSPEDELPILNNTILNTEVVNINYNSTDGKVLIESSDGNKYTADHVIVTPSLGVLKEQYETLFTPELPELKVKIIKGLAMGSVAKIFLSFGTQWWPRNVTGFPFLWSESDKQEYKKDPTKEWLLDVIGCFAVPNRPKKMLCWMNGPGGRHMESLPEEEVLNQTFETLKKFLGKSYDIPRPTGIRRSEWYPNKHFRGTYSFRSTESEAADVWAEQLAAPLIVNGKPIVMFAGEATSPHRYSTVDGAVETGFREGNRLIHMYRNTNDS